VEIAKVVMKQPQILVVDETTTALSQTGRDILYDIIKRFKSEGKAVLFISHDLDEIMEVCDTLTVLRDGARIRDFKKEEFDPDAIRTSMIGRELQGDYYRSDFTPSHLPEIAVTARHITLGTVLNDVDLTVYRGEIVGIGGLSHCGMHPLGKILFGALKPDRGEVVTGKSSEIDWEAVAEAEKCDGYYVIVTSETGWDEDRIIDAYRELWRIEESFKVTKSELRARPVYVWTPEHIEAHFLICFVALTVTRLLQRALGYRWSCEEILDDMAATCMTRLVSNIWVSDHRTDLTDELFALMGSPAPLKQMRLKDVKALFAKSVEIDLRRKSPRKKKSAKKR
jgi:ABC-type Na+ transport system ATPase subunit NatA